MTACLSGTRIDPPEAEWFIPDPESLEEDVVRALSDTSLFAARFRENAAEPCCYPDAFRVSAHLCGCSAESQQI